MIRSSIYSFLILTCFQISYAQEQQIQTNRTFANFSVGWGTTQFMENLNERFEQGGFSSSTGQFFAIEVYHKFNKLNYVAFGLKAKVYGASPSTNDQGEEMFFNFHSEGLSVRYYPFDKEAKKSLFIQTDFMTSQFTQKYRDVDRKIYDHQFAVGNSFLTKLGYGFPIKKNYALTLGIEYEYSVRQGEKQGIGEIRFRNGNLGLSAGITL